MCEGYEVYFEKLFEVGEFAVVDEFVGLKAGLYAFGGWVVGCFGEVHGGMLVTVVG